MKGLKVQEGQERKRQVCLLVGLALVEEELIGMMQAKVQEAPHQLAKVLATPLRAEAWDRLRRFLHLLAQRGQNDLSCQEVLLWTHRQLQA